MGVRRRSETDSIRVLVVDDQESIREALVEMLDDFAYDVAMAEDGEEAIVLYNEFGPDIILLDMNMPRMDGLGVIKYLREVEEDSDVLITMLTSNRSPENKLQAFGAGANDFLYKPFDRAELLARVGVGARQVRLNRRLRQAFDTIDDELVMVAELQERLLPKVESVPVSWPGMSGVRVQSLYRPSGRASGDYFDFFPVGDGVLRAVVADVSGHGARAAFLMGIVRTLFRVSKSHFMGLEETFQLINTHLCGIIGEEEDFATVLAVDLDFERGELRYINAGHCPGVLSSESGVDDLPPTGTVLGFFEMPYQEHRLKLPAGGGLFMYTDGFYDWQRSGGGLFDYDSFRELAVRVVEDGGDFPDRLMSALRIEDGSEPAFRDDVTALWIAFGAQDGACYSCQARVGEARALVRRAIADLAKQIDGKNVLYDLDLALTEAVANVVEHAYPEGQPGDVDVEVRVIPGRSVSMEVRDSGPGFDPTGRDVNPPGPEAVSGRGLYIISQLAETLDVVRRDGMNIVSFTKNIEKEAWKTCG
ncbi:ATP-binding SpoIIE family protein phosphatase [Desulfovibrio ferrophilus]|uniref:Response regulator receiver modulated serine phosphatase n=1 Tax=Desulfovibrio ferrophilus TaxID=241368 RepID=A0A2Z6B0D2_9BACT|nr:SpoIIE family protein phosphatase [Desulfovibrio ferrophilus]BBD08908.1 response regulator receiver modulated serine phosphatase [Desulfovibrio ferrophilus]